MSRFEDLPWVDEDGYLADQGRSFLQNTDQRISRLGLPDFLGASQRKIQELTTPVADLYSGIEQGLSALPSAAQQASTNFLTSTTGRISSLGNQIGQGLGEIGSSIGGAIGGTADDLGELLERQRQDEERRQAEQRQRVQQEEAERARKREELTRSMQEGASQLGGVFDQIGTQAAGRYDDFQQGLQNLRQTDATDLLGGARSGLDRIDERFTAQPGGPEDLATGRQATRLGGRPSDVARAVRTGTDTLRTSLSSLEEGMGQIRGGVAGRDAARARGDLGGAARESAGILGNTALTASNALAAPFRGLGGAYAGGTLPPGADRNLLGLPEDTPVAGGLFNPVELGRLGGEIAGPDLLTGQVFRLLGEGAQASLPLVQRFVREVGDGTIRQAMRQGAEAVGALFDDYVARAAAAAPGGREGRLGRVIGEEEGALRLPGFGRGARAAVIEPPTAVRPPSPPRSSVSDTQTVGETLDAILASQADVAAGRAGKATDAAGPIEKALTDIRAKVYGAWFDQGDSLRRVQSLIERDLKRPLTEAEDAYLHFRLLAGRGDAVAQDVKSNLLPALRGLSKEDERLLNGFLQAADNADKAAAVGGRVELDALGRPLGRVAGESDLRSAKASLAARERLLGASRTTADEAEQTFLRAEDAYRTAAQSAGRRSKANMARLPQLRSARDNARAARDAARRALRDAEGSLERSDIRAGRAAERGERAEAKVEAGRATAETTGMAGAAEQGAQAAAARRFSGGVIAQPLDEVKAEFLSRLGPERAQRLFDTAEKVWAFTRAQRRRLYESGGLQEDTYRAWEEQFPHYVHSDILDFLPDVNGVGGRVTPGGPLLNVADLGLHRQSVEGTTRARDLPLNSVIRQAFSTEGLARRNEGANALLTLREQSPELQRLLRPYEEGVPLRADESILSAFVDGVQQRFVGPKLVVEGLSRFQGEARNAILDTAATIGGAPLLRATATGMNALFIPKNIIRDAWTYVVRTGGAANPGRLKQVTGKLGHAYWDSFTKGDADPDLQEFLRAGGGQAHELFNQTPAEILRRLTREGHLGGRVRPVTNLKDFMGAAGDAMMLPLRGVQGFGEKVERAPRLAQYRLAREAGQSPRRAALAGRDITADFSRGGTYAKVVNRMVPFFNIGLQSPERLITQDFAKGNRLKTGIGLTTSVILPSLAAEAWNRSQAPEDYADVPDNLKDTGLVLMSPVDPPDNPDGTPGKRSYLWLPMPQQYAFLKVVATQALASALGDDRRGWGEVLGAVTESLSPLGEDATSSILPPVARTGLELSANYDYYRKRPIVSERYENLPPEQQATPSTSALGRAVGGVTGQVDLPGIGPMGPAKVDYAVRSLTGGVGSQVLGATDAIARAFGLPAAQERPPGVVDLPVVGGLAGTVLRNQGGETANDAYRMLDAAKARQTREQLAVLHEDPSYQAMAPAERAAVDRRIADRVQRAYDKRYQSIARGNAAEVLEVQRQLEELAGAR